MPPYRLPPTQFRACFPCRGVQNSQEWKEKYIPLRNDMDSLLLFINRDPVG